MFTLPPVFQTSILRQTRGKMSNPLLRGALRGVRLPKRSLSRSAAASQNVTLDQEQKDRMYPKLGNRDIVGWGFNGVAGYADRLEFPCPAVRFGANTPEVMALREKEKGDWNKLSLEEKKALYRASFCRTYAEMKAPTGEWKSVTAGIFMMFAATCWITKWLKTYVYPPMPHTITEEWQLDQQALMIAQGQGRIEGLSSQYDYEKGEFK